MRKNEVQQYSDSSIQHALISTQGSFCPAAKRTTGIWLDLAGVKLMREAYSQETERNKSSSLYSNDHVTGLSCMS